MTDFGAMLRRDVPPARLVDHAVGVSPGFDELWVVEDRGWAGGISQAAAVLAATADRPDLVVGHGIAPAPFRNPVALAMEWATLAELHPGRFHGGVGHGVPGWMAQVGEAVASPLTLLAETIDAVRTLLHGRRLTVSGRYVSVDGVELEFPPRSVPLVSAGVVGPRSLELSGRHADGTVLGEGTGPDDIRAAIEATRRGVADRATATNDGDLGPSAHRLTVFAGFFCGPIEELGPPPNPDAPEGWAAIADAPDLVAAQLRTLADAGADSIVLVPFGQDATSQLRLAADEILPLLRAFEDRDG